MAKRKNTNHARLDRVVAGLARRNQKLKPLMEGVVERDGVRYLRASALADFLGYESFASFKRCVDRAQITADNSGVAIDINFIETTVFDGDADMLLTEWASYAAVLEADPSKPQVAIAKSFFASLAEKRTKHEEARLKERHVFKTLHKRLHTAAAQAGVREKQHAIFDDFGYRGFYNMSLRDVERYKGVPRDEALIDRADHTELAANNLRMSLAADKIGSGNAASPQQANDTYLGVSRIVRKAVIEANGIEPENLPLAKESINELTKRKNKELK